MREAPKRISSDIAYAWLLELFSTNTQLNNVGLAEAIQHHESTTMGKSVLFGVLIMSNLDDVKMSS